MSQNINLFDPAFRKRQPVLSLKTLVGCLVLAVLTLAALHVYFQEQVDGLATELRSAEAVLKAQRGYSEKLKAEAESRKRDSQLHADIARLESELKQARESMSAIRGGAIGTQEGFAEYFRAFSRQSLSGLWLTGLTIAGSGEIEIRGRVLSPDLVPSYIQRLNKEKALAGRTFARLEINQPKVEPEKAKGEDKDGKKAAPRSARFLEFNLATQRGLQSGERPVKERWDKWSARYNAMAPRERVLVFLAAVFGVVYLYYMLVLDPLITRHKRLTLQLAEVRQNIRTAEMAIRAQETVADPDAVRRSYAEALRKQLAEIDQGIQGLQKGLVQPERMAKLLEEMLARGHGLQLVSLRTLPVQRFEHPAAGPAPPQPADKAAKPGAAEPERSIYQHSYELSLQGSYRDLHDYLERLERLPWQMFWGRLSLDTEQYPRLKVTLTVHTLSLNKAWLVV